MKLRDYKTKPTVKVNTNKKVADKKVREYKAKLNSYVKKKVGDAKKPSKELINKIVQIYNDKGLNSVYSYLKKNKIQFEEREHEFGWDNSNKALKAKSEWLDENKLRFHYYSVLKKAKNGYGLNLLRGKEIIIKDIPKDFKISDNIESVNYKFVFLDESDNELYVKTDDFYSFKRAKEYAQNLLGSDMNGARAVEIYSEDDSVPKFRIEDSTKSKKKVKDTKVRKDDKIFEIKSGDFDIDLFDEIFEGTDIENEPESIKNAFWAYLWNFEMTSDTDVYSLVDFYSDFEDKYEGEWDSEEDFAQNLVDRMGGISQLKDPDFYFDWAAFARDLFINDYTMADGFVFSSH